MVYLQRLIVFMFFSFHHAWANSPHVIQELPQLNPAVINDLTIVVSSCDKYAECWKPFCDLLFKYWPGLKKHNKHVPVILIVNKIDFAYPGVHVHKTGIDKSWSDNMLDVLAGVKTKYVMYLQEDYFFSHPVDETNIHYYLEAIKSGKACYVELNKDPYYEDQTPFKEVKNTVIKGPYVAWRPSNQAVIWEKDSFKRIIKPGENPWQFEMHGATRSIGIKEHLLAVVKDHPIAFVNGCHLGYWMKSALDFLAKEGTPVINPKLPIAEDYPFTRWFMRYPKIYKKWLWVLGFFDPKFKKK